VSGLRNIEEEYLLQAIFLAGRIGTRFSLCNTEPYDRSVLISFHVEARIRVGLPGRTCTLYAVGHFHDAYGTTSQPMRRLGDGEGWRWSGMQFGRQSRRVGGAAGGFPSSTAEGF
jgi:hypothetical protein